MDAKRMLTAFRCHMASSEAIVVTMRAEAVLRAGSETTIPPFRPEKDWPDDLTTEQEACLTIARSDYVIGWPGCLTDPDPIKCEKDLYAAYCADFDACLAQ